MPTIGGDRGAHRTGGAARAGSAGARFTLNSEFRPAPDEFAGCFTSIYHMTLDVQDEAALVDYLQPEWGNIRFFAGAAPSAAIGTSAISGARFVATGPSALPCRFTLGTSRMWGIGFLPLGWARFFAADASSLANVICDGAVHPAFAAFDRLSDLLCDPAACREEQFGAVLAALGQAMRPTRDDARIGRIHAALASGAHAPVHELADACAISALPPSC